MSALKKQPRNHSEILHDILFNVSDANIMFCIQPEHIQGLLCLQ